MGAISAFSTATRTLKRNTSLFGAAFLVVLVSYGFSVGSAVLPPGTAEFASLGLSGAMLLLMPFLLGGLLSMADEGLDGTAGFGTFVAGAKASYLRLLGAMVLFGVFVGVVVVVTVIAVAVAGAFAFGANAAGAGGMAASGSVAVLAGVALAAFVAVLLPTFFLQFYALAVVVSDLGVVAAFKRSAGLVRRNLVSTLGYTAVSVVVGLVSGLAATVLVGFGGTLGAATTTTAPALPEMSVGVLAAAAAVSLVVSTVISAFGATYQVAFYDDCS